MANFSFGKFFGRGGRQPRFTPVPEDVEVEESSESLPVGRLVSFTDHGPEDAPLFQELEGPSPSPFVVVGGTRPSATARGLPSHARREGEDGFTAEELTALVPSTCVRPGAVPPMQVIPLPQAVLRASLGAGQPAVLLSQLHQACPVLFVAPTSLDEDLVIQLPPQKVKRLVMRGEGGSPPVLGASLPPPPSSRPAGNEGPPPAWSIPDPSAPIGPLVGPAFAALPSKVKLPPPRRQFDEMQGTDLRPMVENPEFRESGGPFAELGASLMAAVNAVAAPSAFEMAATTAGTAAPVAPAATVPSPFQVASALPPHHSGRGASFTKRFESPFSIISPGEVPAVLESPFARQPMVGYDVPGSPPAAPAHPPMLDQPPEPPSTVSLRLVSLLQGQTTDTLGFAPDRVPPHVRVTLASSPLLDQVASGRIRVKLDDVVAGLDTKYQPAFKAAQPALELHVPLRELFDNLPEVTPPTPAAPPVASTFETPFSICADEDTPLTTATSPFQLATPFTPAPSPAPPALPPAPPALPPAPPALPIPPPLMEFKMPPAPCEPAPAPALTSSPFLLVPDSPPKPEPATPRLDPPTRSEPPAIPPPARAAAAPPAIPPLPPLPPASAATPTVAAPIESATLDPSPLSIPPPQVPLPPLHNPFAMPPGQGGRNSFGLDLPLLPFDEDPVPLESLREDEGSYCPVPDRPAAKQTETSSWLEPAPSAEVAPPVADRPPVLRFALSEQEPLPPAIANPTAGALPQAHEVKTFTLSPAPAPPILPSEVEVDIPAPPAVPAAAAAAAAESPAPTEAPVESPASPASPFLTATTFQLPPLPAELLGAGIAPTVNAPAVPAPAPPTTEEQPVLGPTFATRPPFSLSPATPTADQRAAFASVFAPSALARTQDGDDPPLGEMDSLPAIALAKLPPLEIAPSSMPVEQAAPPVHEPHHLGTDQPVVMEDLSFGYVDNATQLALRAVFATDRTLDTQDVVDLAAGLEGVRACLVHTPHASLPSTPSPVDTDDVRHFRERAATLFEKTASLVRELDPTAREQCFTLRTGKGVVSFFAFDDVCLAVLHGEPSFRPGVREKLTLVTRSVAAMLAA